MRKLLILIIACTVPGLGLADDTRILEIYQCKLNDGKTMEEVQANNTRWLANTRKKAGDDSINSYALEPQVGDLGHFVFIDSYPDLATWARAEAEDESEESKAIEEAFKDLMECEKNRLYKSTKH